MFKAVIFDMDGVIVDTERIHSLAYESILKEFGVIPEKNEHGTVHISGATTSETWEILKNGTTSKPTLYYLHPKSAVLL